MVALDLVDEMQRRDVESAELAREAKVSRSSVLRLRAGRPGRAATRRALREALATFPPVEDRAAAAALTESKPAVSADEAARLENARRLEELARRKDGPQ